MPDDKPLFKEPFEEDSKPKSKRESKPRKESKMSGSEASSHKCGAGQTPVKGFTRKDGKKVAPFCSTKRVKPTLSGVVVAEDKKQLGKMADEMGCEEVAKKLEALSNITKDEVVKKKAKEQADWLRSQPSCKIVREPKKEEIKKEPS